MKLPNVEKAIIDVERIRDYCLNPEHPRGKHKARVFESAVGFSAADAEDLKLQLREGIGEEEPRLTSCYVKQ